MSYNSCEIDDCAVCTLKDNSYVKATCETEICFACMNSLMGVKSGASYTVPIFNDFVKGCKEHFGIVECVCGAEGVLGLTKFDLCKDCENDFDALCDTLPTWQTCDCCDKRLIHSNDNPQILELDLCVLCSCRYDFNHVFEYDIPCGYYDELSLDYNAYLNGIQDSSLRVRKTSKCGCGLNLPALKYDEDTEHKMCISNFEKKILPCHILTLTKIIEIRCTATDNEYYLPPLIWQLIRAYIYNSVESYEVFYLNKGILHY